MSVSLQKGQKVNLSKEHAGLAKVIVGLGWDEAKPSGGGGLFGALFGSSSHQAIDCDASAIMLKNGKFTDKTDLVYFGNLKHKSGTVNHMGDNLTGAGEGDDEQIDSPGQTYLLAKERRSAALLRHQGHQAL